MEHDTKNERVEERKGGERHVGVWNKQRRMLEKRHRREEHDKRGREREKKQGARRIRSQTTMLLLASRYIYVYREREPYNIRLLYIRVYASAFIESASEKGERQHIMKPTKVIGWPRRRLPRVRHGKKKTTQKAPPKVGASSR